MEDNIKDKDQAARVAAKYLSDHGFRLGAWHVLIVETKFGAKIQVESSRQRFVFNCDGSLYLDGDYIGKDELTGAEHEG